MDRVLVIGAGFAGLSRRQAPPGQRCRSHHRRPSQLPHLSTSAVPGGHRRSRRAGRRLSGPDHLQAASRTSRSATADVMHVDLDPRRVVLGDGSILDYDRLIVATGATAGFFGDPRCLRSTLIPSTRSATPDSLRNLLLGCLEDAEARPEDSDGGAPAFVVVGGGATGVETAGAVMELLDASRTPGLALRIDRERTKVVLLDANDRLLSGFDEQASAYAYRDAVLAGCRRPAPDPRGRGQRRGGPPRDRGVVARRGGGLGGGRHRRRHPGGVAARASWPGRPRGRCSPTCR